MEQKENAIYIIRDGKKIKLSPKQYGQDIIYWKNGKVLDIERRHRVRVEDQETIQ